MPISVLFSLNQIKFHFLTSFTTENSSSGVFSLDRSGTNVRQIHEVVHNSPFCGWKVVKKEDVKLPFYTIKSVVNEMVEPWRIELQTFALRTRRSTN